VLFDTGAVDLFIDSRKISALIEAHLGPDVRIRRPETLASALEHLGRDGARVRFDPAGTSAAIVEILERSGAILDRGVDPCELPKACKNQTEQDGMRAAHRRDGLALVKFFAWLSKAGPVTELDAAARLLAFRAENSLFHGPSFETIPGAGPNGAIVHYRATPATNRTLETGSLFLLDSGGQYPDGTTDVTRTLAIGTPTPEMRDRFTRVLKGHIAVASAVFPKGTRGGQLDILARAPLWAEGLDYNHGTGHGVGSYLGVHEGPQRISGGTDTVALQPGMVLSNEPGYYKEGAYGIRIESLLLVVPAALTSPEKPMLAFETLTLAPIDRALIDLDLLSPFERGWMDAYHRRVWDALSPDLTGDVRDWLATATAPL
jgi:Xaa-Pro aminopeptidase